MKIKNAKSIPQIFYGLHFAPGVAEYREPGHDPYRILINENVMKDMDPTFAGRPIYVRHVEEVDLDKLQIEADGYVIESFFNKADGRHWAKMIVVSDKGHEAIRNGWKLSNAYLPKEMGSGGLWHGVEYAKEIKRGEFEHMAIVPDPRYSESIILTPDQYKQYCSDKEIELKKLSNEKGAPMLSFFKKTKVENSADLELMSLTLPTSKIEMTISQMVTEMDTIKNMHGYASAEHMVKVGNDEMSVGDLVKKHVKACNELEEMKKKKDDDFDSEVKEGAEPKKNEEEEQKPGDKEIEMKKNEEKPEEEKKKNEEKEEDKEMKKKKNAHFDALRDAPMHAIKDEQKFELPEDKIARGKVRYGSN